MHWECGKQAVIAISSVRRLLSIHLVSWFVQVTVLNDRLRIEQARLRAHLHRQAHLVIIITLLTLTLDDYLRRSLQRSLHIVIIVGIV